MQAANDLSLYGVAEAEQHFFVQSAANGLVERFYWIQFEHYLPTNTHRYDYPSTRTTDIGGLSFIYDTAVFSITPAQILILLPMAAKLELC